MGNSNSDMLISFVSNKLENIEGQSKWTIQRNWYTRRRKRKTERNNV